MEEFLRKLLKKYKISFFLQSAIIILFNSSVLYANNNSLDPANIGIKSNSTFRLSQVIDLKGQILKMPNGVKIVLNGGLFCNGVIIGQNTAISGEEIAFDKVNIQGSWNVKKISTKLFADLKYANSLKDVFSLSSPNVDNLVFIEDGNYRVSVEKDEDICLQVVSNTKLIINGTIRLNANKYGKYDIIRAEGENIYIGGNGTIIGDREEHKGKLGEWGMGIRIDRCNDISISGLKIRNCWGDCIYVGGNSKNVLIEQCSLERSRRQGISVTKASGVTIKNCAIANISGTNPQCAIDIEPNKSDSVDKIQIDKVSIKDCEGGILVTRRAQKDGAVVPWVGQVSVRNCILKTKSKVPMRINRCETINIENNKFYFFNGKAAIAVNNVENAVIRYNTLFVRNNIFDSAKNIGRLLLGESVIEPISIKKVKQTVIKQNDIIEQ